MFFILSTFFKTYTTTHFCVDKTLSTMSDLDAYVSVYGHDGKPTLVKKIHSRMHVSETVLLT